MKGISQVMNGRGVHTMQRGNLALLESIGSRWEFSVAIAFLNIKFQAEDTCCKKTKFKYWYMTK